MCRKGQCERLQGCIGACLPACVVGKALRLQGALLGGVQLPQRFQALLFRCPEPLLRILAAVPEQCKCRRGGLCNERCAQDGATSSVSGLHAV